MVFIYWPLACNFLADTHAEVLLDPFNIHLHLVTALFIFVEIYVAAFPIRIPHFIYPSITIACYFVMTFLLHQDGNGKCRNPANHAVNASSVASNETDSGIYYPFLDVQTTVFNDFAIKLTHFPLLLNWGCNPTVATTFSVCTVIFGTFLTQLVIFGLYSLRVYIFKYTPENESSTLNDIVSNLFGGISGETGSFPNDLPQRMEPKPCDYF